jgi:hypothetical protein
MTKLLTPDQYIAEMNRRLEQHSEYRKGMAFVPFPEGTTGSSMSGYSVTGPFGLMAIYAQVANEASQDYDLKV